MSNAFEFSTFIKPLLKNLSHTEKRVINGLTKGLPVASIAHEVGKSVRYTDKVIRNLRYKLGGENDQGQPGISTRLLIYYIGLMKLGDEI